MTNSVLQILKYFRSQEPQVEALIIAPGTAKAPSTPATPDTPATPSTVYGFPVVTVPSTYLPRISSLPVGIPHPKIWRELKSFRPDIVHLASPFLLGFQGVLCANLLKIPAVAVFQTDIAGFSRNYRLGWLEKAAWKWISKLHNRASVTLAPSSAAATALQAHGIENIARWGRGVDTEIFHPSRREPKLRKQWDPSGNRLLVGYVGRLAPEKHVERLAELDKDPTVQVVIVGDGVSRRQLETILPNAIFTGVRKGTELAAAYASMDIFIHPGEFETFCQTIQESQASGTPAIAPRAGGPMDLITDNQTGKLLPLDGFAAALPETVHKLREGKILVEMRIKSRQAVLGRTWNHVVAELMRHYQQVLAKYPNTP
ncbi:glycosyltransferase family 4 protein [Corynebacterium caspium]|uniref:glycosyltransferase family 4 protein n=1 Tax=Corynebacterium caspium TaxID=234828 RepID=UPI001FDFF626|nr:glycosyltransferase family 1 protein [Corynebacterium caspium]